MGKLEDYIHENRQEFDAWEPSDGLWQKLAGELDKAPAAKTVRMVPLRRVWQVAAGFAVLLVAALVLQYRLGPKTLPDGLASHPQLDQIAPELVEAEQFYTQQVQLKRQELLRGGAHQLGMDKDMDRELASLDSAYRDLKAELYQTGNQEVVDVMIQNLQFRMDILNKQMEALQQAKKLNQRKNEKQI
jgi:hypothetical protein